MSELTLKKNLIRYSKISLLSILSGIAEFEKKMVPKENMIILLNEKYYNDIKSECEKYLQTIPCEGGEDTIMGARVIHNEDIIGAFVVDVFNGEILNL